MSTAETANVEAILADLQGEIRRYHQALEAAGAVPSTDPLANLRSLQRVNSHLPIGWPVMPGGVLSKLSAYAKKVTRRLLKWYINPLVEQQNSFNAAVVDLLGQLQGERTALQQSKEQLREELRRLAALEQERRQQLSTDDLRMRRLESWFRENGLAASGEASPVVSIREARPEFDYYLLGALYRNEVQSQRSLADYADLFDGLELAQREGRGPAGRVLDIGCGRGQLVAHLCEQGLHAYGIDMDRDAVGVGQSFGRDVRLMDAFTHLEELPDGSLAAVVMTHVAEHFEVDALLALLGLIRRKLAAGGLLVAETPNPACLYSLSNWFLMDPSHRIPLHSRLFDFLLQQAGYSEIEIRFLHPVPEAERLLSLYPTGTLHPTGTLSRGEDAAALEPLLRRLDHNIEQLNEMLYGPQDYAVIAHNGQSDG